MKSKGNLRLILAAALLIVLVPLTLVSCAGKQGLQGPAGPAGAAGAAGAAGKDAPLPAGTTRELAVALEVSKPASGTFFAAGQAPVVTITLKDTLGKAFAKDDFATLGLYMYGPQETTKTKTAVKMLNATADRTKTPHHFIDLLTNTDAKIAGNVVTYNLKPVTDEEAGTYTVSLRATEKADALQQVMLLADVQIGTATVEKQIVEKANCAACHLGADSGKIYMAHIDPNATGTSLGNWAIDFEPVRTCKACHNNEGYAAYRGDINNPTGATTVRTPDNIVLRVHGVHMGEHLTNTFNTDPTTGNYKDYTGVLFPPNVKSCTVCHADDRWKTMPSVQACSACHDNTWFGAVAGMPKTFVAHPGGPQANDAACAACHQAEGTAKPSVAGSHKVIQVYDQVALSMTPPKSGKFYAAGDKPVVTVVVKDAKGNPIDHTKVDTTNFGTANLYVYGPRYESKPVLTNAAKNRNSKASASATSSIPASGTPTKGWTFAAGDTFKIAVHGGAIQELAALAGLQTPDQVAAWLKASLKDVTVTANNTAGSVNIRSNLQGDNSKFAIYNSAVTTIMGWKPVGLNIIEHGKVVGQTVGTTMEPFVVIGAASNAANDLRKQSSATAYADPAVTRTAANITYQLDDMAGLKAGTYMVYMYTLPVAGKFTDMSSTAFGLITFQVGTETPELKVATNCTDCHKSTIWHLDEGPIHAEPFDTDWCKACHDYNRSGTGEGFSRTGGTSTSGWAGYGSKPIVARVHGVHRGAYLHRPDEVYAGNPNVFAEVIFPQDIRNCTKCHDPKTTSGTWKTEPSRLACLACHDSDEAKAHGNVMTVLPSPDYDPYGAQAVETCKLCHGAGRDFSPDKVHSISSPFHPPYLREPKLEE